MVVRGRAALVRTGRLLAVAFLMALGLQCVSASPALAAGPTMTFTGSVNALGVLTALNLTPTDVAVPAGGVVRFVNDSGTPLTLSVGNQTVSLPDGEARTARFDGGAAARSVAASATAFDLPVVGSLTSTTGTVTVAAARSTPPAGASAAPTSRPASAAPAAQPLNPASPAAPSPQPTGLARPSASARETGRRPADEPIAGVEPAEGDVYLGDEPAPLDGRPAQAAVSDSTVTTVGDGRGLSLLILVATVLLGGIGTAAIRSVVSVRGTRATR